MKLADSTEHIHMYIFRINVLYIICKHLHNLPPYQNSHACSQSPIVIVSRNLTKHMQIRQLALSHSITVYIQYYFTFVHQTVAPTICTVSSVDNTSKIHMSSSLLLLCVWN